MDRDNSYLIGNKHGVGSGPNSTSFKKGQVPWNKGKKGMRMSPATEFKKGQKSLHELPVGTITKRTHKGDKTRKWIKTNKNEWIELAKNVWVERYGPILQGDIIHHMNGDALDDDINNLIAMPRGDHPKFDSRWGLTLLSADQVIYYLARYLDALKDRTE